MNFLIFHLKECHECSFVFNKTNFNTHLKYLELFKFRSLKASDKKRLESEEKTSSVICVNKGQHITDSVGTVHAAADYAVRPHFFDNVVNTALELYSIFDFL